MDLFLSDRNFGIEWGTYMFFKGIKLAPKKSVTIVDCEEI